MFKIKDNVDLKILEDFGFIKINGTCYSYEIANEEEWGHTSLEVSVLVYQEDFMGNKERHIYFYTYAYAQGEEDEVSFDKTFPADVLFELFEAGLIERVSE
jgi:hypothetical protein